jgi:dipeptidyl aminopeptidase/acylaminoacyl peptidase
MRKLCWLSLLGAAALAAAQTAPRRALNLDDMARMRSVSSPQCSPDGKDVAYVVGTTDAQADKHHSHIWMVDFAGGENTQMTDSESSESSPKWSPDGKYLSFTSSRPGPAKGNQVWLLPRAGGEATQLTDIKGSLEGYEWAPDSRRLALVIQEPAPERKPDAPPLPIVVDRYRFRHDNVGFLSDRHTFIYIFDIAGKKLTRLTAGKYDESDPKWSPDGTRIAFFSNHDAQPQREDSDQIYVIAVRPGAVEHAVTKESDHADGGAVAWSPDGRTLAFLMGQPIQWDSYTQARLATVPADGSAAPTVLTQDFDRAVSSPRFTPDGRAIEVLVTDDRSEYPATVSLSDHSVTKLEPPPIVVSSLTRAGGCTAALVAHPEQATEVYALPAGAAPRPLSHQNDALFAQLKLGRVQGVESTSPDGTRVGGILTLPVDYTSGKVPLLLRIHGGPNSQNSYSFSLEDQEFAAHGYAVLNVNYRGSAGRGQAFAKSIAADWGHLEVIDLEAAVDHVIQMGIADPDRLGVGGWSYGGILTDYLIATNTRFKAATDGAGTGFTVSFYGVDQYINQYNYEIGPPWDPKAWAIYQKIAYPFLHADRIKTPTIYFGGTLDANVPLVGGEQMYQALKTLGVPTELIVYPDQYHGIARPSFQRDRMQRYLDWYDKYLKK